jgi:hypothetical protein
LHYRIYLLSEQGRIERATDLDCPDDSAAISVLIKHRHQYNIELWQGSRRVRTFDPVARPLKSAEAKRVDVLAAIAILLSEALVLAEGEALWEVVRMLQQTLAAIAEQIDVILDGEEIN